MVKNSTYKVLGCKINKSYFTIEDYNKLFEKQEGRCKICKENLIEGKTTHIDHNHEIGEVRGLLCSHCNLILGHSKESIIILNNVINYINEYL